MYERFVDREIKFDVGEIRKKEVREAIKETKNGKAPGADQITAELFKVSRGASVKELTRLFRQVWDEERIPDKWKKGLIVKLPKKGDLRMQQLERGDTSNIPKHNSWEIHSQQNQECSR